MKAPRKEIFRYAVVFTLLSALIWGSEFLLSGQFGLYEDDYTRIPAAMGWTWQEFFRQAWTILSTFGGQGRPLQPVLVDFFSRLAGSMDSFHSLYIFGFLNLSILAFLFYLFLERTTSPAVALMGSIAFVLFPADTTQPFLYHSLGLYPALTCFLIAALFYLSDHYLPAYLFLFFSLMIYETIVPVFLAIPLFLSKRDKKWMFRFAANGAVVFIMLLGSYVLRMLTAEKRVIGLSLRQLIQTPIIHMAQGPLVSLGTYAFRPLQVIQNLDRATILAVLIAAIAFIILLDFARKRILSDSIFLTDILKWKRDRAPLSQSSKDILRWMAIGLVMLVLSYALTFTVRAVALTGRDTRVHLSAVLGASLIAGCAMVLVLDAFQSLGRGRIGAICISVYFALLLGFGIYVQQDYQLAWQLQVRFWQDIFRLCPDVTDGTVILVEPEGFPDAGHIVANGWNLPRVFDQLVEFPATWEQPPEVFRLEQDWEEHILEPDGGLRLNVLTALMPSSLSQDVDRRNVILLQYDGDHLSRVSTATDVDGILVDWKEPGELVLPTLPTTALFDFMLASE